MVEVSSSILNMKKGEEIQTIMNLENAKTNYFHIDVMDGKFVENNNYEQMLENCGLVERLTLTPLDVHLMVENVEDSIYDFAKFNPNIITFHLEALDKKEDVLKIINQIKDEHIKVGIAIKPETSIDKIYEYLPYIHQVLIMTVEPGKGGQTLLKDMSKKVEQLKKYILDNQLEVDIEVDGGINLATDKELKKAGANILVAGSAILKAKDYKVIIEELKEN